MALWVKSWPRNSYVMYSTARRDKISDGSKEGNFFFIFMQFSAKNYAKQECIPVGCVPATRRPYAGVSFLGGFVCLVWGGVCLVRGVSALGVSAWSRGSAWSGGICLVQGGGLPGPGGWSAWLGGWGVVLGGPGLGGSAWSRGSGILACTEADILPPCGQTDTCKNITLATTSLHPVIMG